ncbi:flavodoxin domain-containing protein [Roseomonas chloroacetimidivorans]|uniref:flavodoxin domain-containing protein n=1 Tax=Roseomonas chloroacetimidivorans TaxID=1766656 RepID=UPI003C724A96
MSATIILVATMTGTAEMIAEDIEAAHGASHTLEIRAFERSSPEILQQAARVLIVSSTYGEGEVPEPSLPFFEAVAADRPDLRGLRYGVIALGDSSYMNSFARGGSLWDELLASCGAVRDRPLLVLDASSQEPPSDRAVEWSGRWLAETAEVPPCAEPGP